MIIPDWTTEHLKKLPLRAIVALAARCARRVESHAALPDDHPDHERCGWAVRNAIKTAEDFARDSSHEAREDVIAAIEGFRDAAQGERVRDSAIAAIIWTAHATAAAEEADALQGEPEQRHLFAPPSRPFAHLAGVNAEFAALDALTAAGAAADAVGNSDYFINGVTRDYQTLLGLNLGSYPDHGGSIDPSPDGPLGPL
jgi:hypothetical protein